MFQKSGSLPVVLGVAVFFFLPVTAQQQLHGPRSYHAVKHDTSGDLRDLASSISSNSTANDEETREREYAIPTNFSRSPEMQVADPVMQSSATTPNHLKLGLSFDGVSHGGWKVADPNLAVGQTQVVQWVNTNFAVYDKTSGALTYGPVGGNTWWKGFGGACQTNNSGDPIAQYDKLAGRWVMLQHTNLTGGAYYMCLAVSTTSDATGSFNRYVFILSANFADYPKLAVWPDAYYVTFDQYQGTSVTSSVCALDRNAMLNNAPATAVCFQANPLYAHLLPSDADGLISPPAGSPDYIMSFGTNSLLLWQFHVDFQTPGNSTFTGPINIPVAAFSEACNGGACVPQFGTGQQLDSLADRLMYRLAYRHFSDGHESLVVTHSVGSPSGVRWYEIRSPGSSPVVYQSGTYSPDSKWRWMGSIATDQAGDIAMGYSVSSNTIHPGIGYTGRLVGDPLGTMEAEGKIIAGVGSEQPGNYRWDDYTSLSVDPVDDCTFWYTNEYYKSNGIENWSTRIASFKFPTCP